jgi:hypothetical protein
VTLHRRAADTPPKRPLLLANYYCWYHAGSHPTRPFAHSGAGHSAAAAANVFEIAAICAPATAGRAAGRE